MRLLQVCRASRGCMFKENVTPAKAKPFQRLAQIGDQAVHDAAVQLMTRVCVGRIFILQARSFRP